jgi:hypothetical protein
METFSNVMAKTLAGIFAVLFVLTTVLAFALNSVERSAFDAELYKQALNEEYFYQRLPELAARELTIAAQQPERNDMLALFRNLSEDEWRIFVSQLFPPTELKTLAESAVTQIIAYINGETDTVALSLASLKAHLASPEGVNAIYGVMKAQPDCSLEQLSAMAMGQVNPALCNPPDTFLFVDLRPIIEAQIKTAVSLVPEQVTIISPNNTQPQDLQDLKTLRTIMRLSPLVPMLCLLLVTVLAIRSFRGWLVWWGYPLLLAGLFSMLLSGMSRSSATWFFGFAVSSRLPETLSADIVGVFSDLMASIVHNALQPVVKQAGVIALVGLVMVVFAFLIRATRHKMPKQA